MEVQAQNNSKYWYDNFSKNMTNHQLAEISIEHCKYFLSENNLHLPRFVIINSVSSGKFCADYCYPLERIRLYLPSMSKPQEIPWGPRWSYPGNRIDRTPVGVVAHEIGHHIDKLLNISSSFKVKNKITANESPDIREKVAESIRLFILNPDLLKVLHEDRYWQLISSGIAPITDLSWIDIFTKIGINSRYINRVNELIK